MLQEESRFVGQSTFKDDMHDVLRSHGNQVEIGHIGENAFVVYAG